MITNILKGKHMLNILNKIYENNQVSHNYQGYSHTIYLMNLLTYSH